MTSVATLSLYDLRRVLRSNVLTVSVLRICCAFQRLEASLICTYLQQGVVA